MDKDSQNVSFVKFDYVNKATEKTSLVCRVQFIAQTPNDPAARLTTRAILVCFDAKDSQDRIHLETKVRVAFSFEGESEIPTEEIFLDQYCPKAYLAFREKILETLKVMDITGFTFPDELALEDAEM